MKERTDGNQQQLMLRMALRALVTLVLLIAVLVLLKKLNLKDLLLEWLQPLTSKPWLVYTIFIASESYIGFIPPEIFMMFALDRGFWGYYQEVLLLALLSNLGGLIGFSSGKYLGHTRFVRKMTRRKKARRYVLLFKKYGGLVILLAAVTPLPFALISIMGGTLNLPYRTYIINALPRILRFFLYAYFVWQANGI